MVSALGDSDLRRALTRRKRAGTLITAICALAMALPTAVQAAPSMPGPAFLATGFADPVFQDASGSVRTQWLNRAQRLRSTWVRVAVPWALIAPPGLTPGFQPANPGDPRYNWSQLDESVRAAAAHRQTILLMLYYAPAWAEGQPIPSYAIPGTWRPNADALGAFARALATRYSGDFPDPLQPGTTLPRVTYFQPWNEPNLRTDLAPQWTQARNGSFLPASPSIYRAMLNAVYASVKAVQPHAYVLAAGTAPYGDPPGVDRMAPVVFTRELLCLQGAVLRPERCPNPAHFDALDHHPYAFTPTRHAFNADDVSVPDLGKLQRIVRLAAKRHRVLPAGTKPIWVTEIAWQEASEPLQARYLALAFYELWRQGVSHVFWLLIRDIPYRFGASGVYSKYGRAKPSAAAFAFPFVALPAHGGMVTLWGRAPVAGVVTIEKWAHHGWQPGARLATTPGGIFYAARQLGAHLRLRAVIGAIASPAWQTG